MILVDLGRVPREIRWFFGLTCSIQSTPAESAVREYERTGVLQEKDGTRGRGWKLFPFPASRPNRSSPDPYRLWPGSKEYQLVSCRTCNIQPNLADPAVEGREQIGTLPEMAGMTGNDLKHDPFLGPQHVRTLRVGAAQVGTNISPINPCAHCGQVSARGPRIQPVTDG